MEGKYHRQMLNDVLDTHFNKADLNIITHANLRQDWPRGQLHPEYHFDNSTFAESEAYIQQQRQFILDSLSAHNREEALATLGRLLHTRQDFYAHSNWVRLWVEQQGGLSNCAPETVPLCKDPPSEQNLVSGTGNLLRWLIYRIPLLGPLVKGFYFPQDSHEAMNLDSPKQGPLFAYALSAATRHTQLEFDRLLAGIEQSLGETAVADFLNG